MATETEIASLLVKLGADIEGYTRDFERAQRIAEERATGIDKAIKKGEAAFARMGKAVSTVNTAIAALGAGAAISAIERLGRQALDTAGALQDTSERVGVNVEKLQELRLAGLTVGIAFEQTDSILAKFGKNTAEAAQGQGDLADITREYGLRLRDNHGFMRNSMDLLADYADIIKNAGSQQQRLSLAQAAFGKEGSKFVNVLQGGSAAFREQMSAARELGGVLSKDLVAAGDEAGDKLDLVKARLENAFNKGFLKGIVGNVDNIDEAMRRMLPTAEKFGENVATAMEKAASAAEILSRHLPEVKDALLGIAGIKLSGPLAAILGVGAAPIAALAAFAAGLDAILTKTSELPKTLEESQKRLAAYMALPAYSQNDPGFKAAVQQLKDHIAKLTAETDKNTASTKKNAEASDEAAQSGSGWVVSTIQMQDAFKEAALTLDQHTRELADNNREIDAAIEKQQKQREAVDTTIDGLENEIQVLDLRARGFKQQADLLEEEIRLRASLGQAYYMNAADIDVLLRKRQDLTEAIERNEEAEQKAQEAADRMNAIWDEATRDMFDTWRDGWRDLLSGKIKDFESFAKRILNIGLDLAANLLAAQSWNGAFGGALTGGGGGATGKAGSMLSNAGSSAAGGWLASQLPGYNPVLAGSVAGAGVGGMLGYNIGGMISDRTGAKVGGAVAGTGAGLGAGAYIMAGGNPLIGLAAYAGITALGALFGSLFGGHPSDKTELNDLLFDNGKVTQRDLGPKKDSPENRQAVDQLTQVVMNIDAAFKAAGLKHTGDSAVFGAGSRDGNFRVVYNKDGVQGQEKFFQTQEEAVKYTISQIIGSLDEIPAALQDAVDHFDPSKLEEFIDKVSDYGAYADTLKGIQDQIKQLTDPKQYALDQLDEEFKGIRESAAKWGEGSAEVERYYGLRRLAILRQFGDAGADVLAESLGLTVDGLQETADAASAIDDAMQRVTDRLKADIDLRMEGLNAERAALEDQRSLAQRLVDDVKSAKLRFLTDKSLFRGTNEERLNELMDLLDQTYAKAQNGDAEAQQNLTEIALAAAQANNDFNASSEAGNEIQNKIMGILNNTESMATRQLRVAELALAANQAQVDLLQKQLDIASGAKTFGQTASASTPAQLDATTAAYQKAYGTAMAGGMSEQDWLKSPVFAAFQAEMLDLYSRLDDKNRLQSDLNLINSAPMDSPYSAGWQQIGGTIRSRLHALGVPGFREGGDTGGLALVHPGEWLYTGPPAHVVSARETVSMGNGMAAAIDGLRSDVRTLAEVVSISSSDQVAKLSAVVSNLSRMTGNLELAVARR